MHNDLLTHAQLRDNEQRLGMTFRERLVIGITIMLLGAMIGWSAFGNPV